MPSAGVDSSPLLRSVRRTMPKSSSALTTGRPERGVSSAGTSEVVTCRMDSFVAIALSSSQTNGVCSAFTYVASATAESRTTTNVRRILHYYLTHAARAGACDVPRAVAAFREPLFSARSSHELRDHGRRPGAHVLDIAVGVSRAGARSRSSVRGQHVLSVSSRGSDERLDAVARGAECADSSVHRQSVDWLQPADRSCVLPVMCVWRVARTRVDRL